MKDIQAVHNVLDTTTESHSINFQLSTNQLEQSVQKRIDIWDSYASSYNASSSSSFIEEFAYGNKTLAVGRLIHKAHGTLKRTYDVDEARIYDELASKEWNDYQEYILLEELLDYDSIA